MAKRLSPKTYKKLDKTIHAVWTSMKGRCYNQNNPDYQAWGGRGITVCSDWLYYENFLNDMLPTYQKGLTLDRIDNNGNYSKENCRWATQKVQCSNTRTIERANRISYLGITDTITNWAKYLGVKRTTLGQRIKYGWTIERILFEPLHYQTN